MKERLNREFIKDLKNINQHILTDAIMASKGQYTFKGVNWKMIFNWIEKLSIDMIEIKQIAQKFDRLEASVIKDKTISQKEKEVLKNYLHKYVTIFTNYKPKGNKTKENKQTYFERLVKAGGYIAVKIDPVFNDATGLVCEYQLKGHGREILITASDKLIWDKTLKEKYKGK